MTLEIKNLLVQKNNLNSMVKNTDFELTKKSNAYYFFFADIKT